jgi:hypothetical protein
VTVIVYEGGSDNPVTGVQESGGVSVPMVKFTASIWVWGQAGVQQALFKASQAPWQL